MTETPSRRRSYGEARPPTWVDRFGVWLSARRISFWVEQYPRARIGDIGCGYHGGIARLFADNAESLVVTDLSLSPALKDHPGMIAIEGKLPGTLARIADESLDVVICNSVIEHLWEPLELLGELRRITAPGGICLINAPSWRGKWFLEFSAYRLGLSPPEEMDDHKTYYDPHDLLPLLEEVGFAPENIRCFKHKFGLNTFAECRKPTVDSPAGDGEWDRHWRQFTGSAKLNPAQAFRRRLIIGLLDGCGAQGKTKILDIGCGSGDLLAAINKRYSESSLAGMDISPTGLAETRKKLPHATLAQWDLNEPKVDPGELQGWATHAVCSEVLEHVDDPVKLLANAAAFMRTGCALVVTVPGGPLSAFDKHLGHRRHYTKETLTETLESAGFDVINMAAAGFPMFNLYKLVVIVRGKKLIADAGGRPGFMARSVMALFRLLLPLSLSDSPHGWQIAAIAMKKD